MEPMRLDRKASVPRAGTSSGASTGTSRIAASTLVRITRSNSASVGGCAMWLVRGPYTPALTTATSMRSPSSCQAMPAISFGSSTSSFRVWAPRSRSRMRSSSLRWVANTVQPASMYWRTNSRPMPREAPTISAVAMRCPVSSRRSDHLESDRDRLAAANAQRGDAPLATGLAQRPEQRDHQARARAADRVAQRGRAAVQVDLFVRQVVLAHRGHGHHRESLVDLEEVGGAGVPARLRVELLDGADRRGGEPLRFLRMRRVGDEAGDRRAAELLRGGLAH